MVAPTQAELWTARQAGEAERVKNLILHPHLRPGDAVRYRGPTAFDPSMEIIGKLIKIENGLAHIEIPAKVNHVGQIIANRVRLMPAEYVEPVK